MVFNAAKITDATGGEYKNQGKKEGRRQRWEEGRGRKKELEVPQGRDFVGLIHGRGLAQTRCSVNTRQLNK